MPIKIKKPVYPLIALITVYLIAIILNAVGLSVWLPSCPINNIIGIECLGCGTNRALIELIKGDYVEAFEHNQLIFLYIIALLFWGILVMRSISLQTQSQHHEQV